MIDAEDEAFGDFSGRMELDRLREMFARSPSFSALLDGPEHRFVFTNPAYQQLIGHRDVIGLTVLEAIPEVESQGFVESTWAESSRERIIVASLRISSVSKSSAIAFLSIFESGQNLLQRGMPGSRLQYARLRASPTTRRKPASSPAGWSTAARHRSFPESQAQTRSRNRS
jgi:hypothetical protein